MHPSIEQLLAESGSHPDAEIQTHLGACVRCRRDVQGIGHTRERLISLPQLEPPEGSWTKIQAALQASPSRPSRLWSVAAAAGVAALAVLAVSQHEVEEAKEAVAPIALNESVQPTERIAALMEQSRHLDLALQGLPNRPRVERVAMAATLDSIEDRIQWLDVQLTYASATPSDDPRTQTLWRERVELMDSLVKVRYAQAGRASF